MTERRIAIQRRLAVNECEIELIKQLKAIDADMGELAKDLDFVVDMESREARINRYNGVIINRYCRLAEKILTVWQRITPNENAPDGKLENQPEKSHNTANVPHAA